MEMLEAKVDSLTDKVDMIHSMLAAQSQPPSVMGDTPVAATAAVAEHTVMPVCCDDITPEACCDDHASECNELQELESKIDDVTQKVDVISSMLATTTPCDAATSNVTTTVSSEPDLVCTTCVPEPVTCCDDQTPECDELQDIESKVDDMTQKVDMISSMLATTTPCNAAISNVTTSVSSEPAAPECDEQLATTTPCDCESPTASGYADECVDTVSVPTESVSVPTESPAESVSAPTESAGSPAEPLTQNDDACSEASSRYPWEV
jgi:tetrahydromethanopterin S-methyltransferase subunit G